MTEPLHYYFKQKRKVLLFARKLDAACEYELYYEHNRNIQLICDSWIGIRTAI
jgi:hypothetical protein